MLYVVSTPIGNLQDITLRALEVLRSVDYILCEDTRHSGNLLRSYSIKKSLLSFHQFNEKTKEERIIADMKEGKTVALISDAGTPLIHDPGRMLVQRCHEESITVCAIPGACAPIAAITMVGFDAHCFQFIGFLPKKQNERIDALRGSLLYAGTTICFEAPHRILKTLAALQQLAPFRRIALARELTKQFETCLIGTVTEVYERATSAVLKGEMILLISGAIKKVESIEEEIVELKRHPIDKESIARLAKKCGVSKRVIYNKVMKLAL